MSTPDVSVVIPVHNRPKLVRDAIDTVLAQTVQPSEIIVVDDASTDSTPEAVEAIDDPRIQLISLSQNVGAAQARNEGIDRATGAFVAFLDSDDRWHERKLEKQLEALASSPWDQALVYTGEEVRRRSDWELVSTRRPTTQGQALEEMLWRDFVGTCSSVLVNRSILTDAEGFDGDLPSRQDWDLWLRICQDHPVVAVPEPLVTRTLGEDQISGSIPRILEGTRNVVEKHEVLYRTHRRAYGKNLASIAFLELLYDRRQGMRRAAQALRYHPFQVRLLGAGVLALAGRKVYRWAFQAWNRGADNLYLTNARIQDG